MCSKVLPPATREFMCNSTTATDIPMTGWIPAASIKQIQALIEVAGGGAQFRAAPRLQVATNDTSNPGAWADVEATANYIAPGTKDTTDLTDISSSLTAVFFVRFGVSIKLNSGTTLTPGEVTLAIAYRT